MGTITNEDWEQVTDMTKSICSDAVIALSMSNNGIITDLSNAESVDSLEECKAMCHTNSNCVGISYLVKASTSRSVACVAQSSCQVVVLLCRCVVCTSKDTHDVSSKTFDSEITTMAFFEYLSASYRPAGGGQPSTLWVDFPAQVLR